MKINFYIRPSRTDDKPIKMYISLNGDRAVLHTQLHIDKKKWSAKEQRVSLKKFPTDAARINPELTKLSELADNLFIAHRPDSAKELMDLISNEHFKNLKPKKSEVLKVENGEGEEISFFTAFDLYLKDCQTRINSKTAKVISGASVNQYRSFKETLMRYEEFTRKENESYKMAFKIIDNAFYSDFRSFCIEEEDLSPNTFGGKIKRLKSFLFWCQGRDYKVSNKFWDFEIPQSYKDAEPLSGDELASYWKLDIGPEQWKLDIVLALCSSGMRISDYNIVMTNMDRYIQNTKNGKALIFKAQKTGVRCMVPVTDDNHFRIKSLYEKYNGKMPSLSGQRLNEFMKDSKIFPERIPLVRLGSKIGRISLCSIKYFELGIEAQYIMPITGHKTESEFKKYLGVNANTIIKANKAKSVPLPNTK